MRGLAVVSDGIYFLHGAGANRIEIRFYRLADGSEQVVSAMDGRSTYGVAVSPDRQTILYSKFVSRGADLMMIENFR